MGLKCDSVRGGDRPEQADHHDDCQRCRAELAEALVADLEAENVKLSFVDEQDIAGRHELTMVPGSDPLVLFDMITSVRCGGCGAVQDTFMVFVPPQPKKA